MKCNKIGCKKEKPLTIIITNILKNHHFCIFIFSRLMIMMMMMMMMIYWSWKT